MKNLVNDKKIKNQYDPEILLWKKMRFNETWKNKIRSEMIMSEI